MDPTVGRPTIENRIPTGSEGLVSILATIIPVLSKILIDADRVASTTGTISSQVLSPIFRSKSFPDSVTQRTLDLLIALSAVPEASKACKKDIAEAFNDSRFFSTPLSLAQNGWLPLLRSWVLADKERMPELLSRLAAPTTAGLMFGVGATSARVEADRRTQTNLRRIALLILASADDTFVVNLPGLQEKLIELMNATAASSPSSNTRSEIYMVIRALLLKIAPIHLSSFWPTVNSEMQDALSSTFPETANEVLPIPCLLQTCKLLDTLLSLQIDEFQMQEWLFVADTTDALYRPPELRSVALVDELAEDLDSSAGSAITNSMFVFDGQSDMRKPLLSAEATRNVSNEEMMDKVLRPFFRQLSIFAFESTYSMQKPDWKASFDDLMTDLFDDSTLV